mgnify:CR=1 FL=1
MKLTRVGVDLAKNAFQVHGVDRAGRCVWKRQLKRAEWLRVLTEPVEPGCEIGLEACGGAHHWGRELRARGLVAEYGLVAPKQFSALRQAIPGWLEDAENGLTTAFRALLNGLWEELLSLVQCVEDLDTQIKVIAQTHPDVKRLQRSIPLFNECT